MNENIDLTKILKDCPEGTKLYSPIFGEVIFKRIADKSEIYPIKAKYYSEKYERMDEVSFTKEGLFLNQTDTECILFFSREQRDWSKFKAPWYKKSKFDPRTLKPFQKVLIWKELDCTWMPTLFTFLDFSLEYPRMRYDSLAAKVIPYNDDTKHLVGTTNEAPEYYRYWED